MASMTVRRDAAEKLSRSCPRASCSDRCGAGYASVTRIGAYQ